MTDRLQELIDLRDKVKAGFTSRRPSEFKALWDPDHAAWASKAMNGSLDAAYALHEAVLPGCSVKMTDDGPTYTDSGRWQVKINWEHMTWNPGFTASGPFGYEAINNIAARAWLIAILEALIAQEGRS